MKKINQIKKGKQQRMLSLNEKVKECKEMIDRLNEKQFESIYQFIKVCFLDEVYEAPQPTAEELEAEKKEQERKEKEWKEWQQALRDCEAQFEKVKKKALGRAATMNCDCLNFMDENRLVHKFLYWFPKRSLEAVEVLYMTGYKAGKKAEKKRQIKKATTQPTK